ncbi:MAG TPA: SURF1 family protein [Burkholderiaceae bacterium]|nr:SURF1 family protein [Burkholderiaceae bacterium]
MNKPPSLAAPHRPSWRLLAVTLGGVVLIGILLALGTWQVRRLAWKEALIARIEVSQAGEPQPLPPVQDWPRVQRDTHEYQRLVLTGHFDHDRETLVQASTVLGPGWWVITPLQTAEGRWVLVNRGFVDAAHREPATRVAAQGEVRLQGLLRITEPEGRLWQHNDARAGRWYSRDVAAVAAARELRGEVAPFFVDASEGREGREGQWPRAGLTVLAFSNNHLMYALTWFALAAMVIGALVFVWRYERRRVPGAAAVESDA